MARTQIPVITSVRGDGINMSWTAADAGNGMYWDNSGETPKLLFIRTGATDTTPTINAEDTIDGLGIEDKASLAVGTNNDGKVYGPYPNYPYGDANEQCTLDLSADTDVFVAVVAVGSLALT